MLQHKAKLLQEHPYQVRTANNREMGEYKLRQSVMSHVMQRGFVEPLAAET
jgi:hypothetical protein